MEILCLRAGRAAPDRLAPARIVTKGATIKQTGKGLWLQLYDVHLPTQRLLYHRNEVVVMGEEDHLRTLR